MERSGFFNAIIDQNGTPDRSYSAENFARYFGTFIGNGVFPNPSTQCQVIANDDMTVTIKAGRAWINGYMYENTDDHIVALDVADGLLNRIDRVVLKLDFLNREIKSYVKKGTFASSPTAPTLQRDADAYELGIADIYIAAGATSIAQANIADQRQNQDLCGIVDSLITADTKTLFNQFTDGFNSWFAGIKNTLGSNVAGNLLNKINELAGTGRADETVKGVSDALNAHKSDNTVHVKKDGTLQTGLNAEKIGGKTVNDILSNTLKISKSNLDANGIYKQVDYKREDGTLYIRSVLSGGTSPNYTTRTITIYDTNGSTVLKTITHTLTYDTNNNIVSEL